MPAFPVWSKISKLLLWHIPGGPNGNYQGLDIYPWKPMSVLASYFISTLHVLSLCSLPVLNLAFPELPEIPVSYSTELQSFEEWWLLHWPPPRVETGLFVSSQTIWSRFHAHLSFHPFCNKFLLNLSTWYQQWNILTDVDKSNYS